MSAFMCNDYHISILAATAVYRYRCNSNYDPEFLGKMLFDANLASINARYPASRGDADPVFTFDDRALVNYLDYSHVAIIKACRCFDYQACEHAAWDRSEAKRIIDAILYTATTHLAGYDNAEWEMRERPASGRVLLSGIAKAKNISL